MLFYITDLNTEDFGNLGQGEEGGTSSNVVFTLDSEVLFDFL
jgi:hypothetical protein